MYEAEVTPILDYCYGVWGFTKCVKLIPAKLANYC